MTNWSEEAQLQAIQDSLPGIEARIRASIKKAQDAGIQIISRDWRVFREYDRVTRHWKWTCEGDCCAIGAVLWDTGFAPPMGSYEHVAAGELRVSASWVTAFVRGFDGEEKVYADEPWFQAAFDLGCKLRKEYIHALPHPLCRSPRLRRRQLRP